MYAIAKITDQHRTDSRGCRFTARVLNQVGHLYYYIEGEGGKYKIDQHVLISFHPDDQFAQVITMEELETMKKKSEPPAVKMKKELQKEYSGFPIGNGYDDFDGSGDLTFSGEE